jgi:hypothetical protein
MGEIKRWEGGGKQGKWTENKRGDVGKERRKERAGRENAGKRDKQKKN